MTSSITIINNERVYHDSFTVGFNATRRAVKTGCGVTENSLGADMSVDVASGTAYFDNTEVSVTGINIAIDAADPLLDRFDLVVVDNGGTISIIKGTADADPRPPTFDIDDCVVLARVFIDDGSTTILDANIKDNRVIFTNKFTTSYIDIIPNIDNTYDIGSSSLKWKDGYFAGNVSTLTVNGETPAGFKHSTGVFNSTSTTVVTIVDSFCTADSLVTVAINDTTSPVGIWTVDSGSGSFDITSTFLETEYIDFDYYINRGI